MSAKRESARPAGWIPAAVQGAAALTLLFLLAWAGAVGLAGCSAPPRGDGGDPFDSAYRIEGAGSRPLQPPANPILAYLKKRGLDFLDMVSFRITAGPGLRAHARVTKIVQVGIGKMGSAEATTMGTTFPLYKLGYLKREGGLWKERSHEIGISLFYYYHSVGESMGGNKTTFGEEDRGFWDVGAAVHWFLIGAEAEVRFEEIFDFVTGFFGLDVMNDDVAERDPDILETEDGG